MLGSWSDYPRIVFLLAEAIHGVSAEVLNLQISWQAQYLLRFEVDFACSAHSKCRFICDRNAKCCIFQYKIVFEVGRVRSPKRRVRDDDFMLGWSSDGRRIIVGLSSDCRRIVFLLAEAIHGVSAEVLNLQISWQAQYLVRLVADCACSAHCK